MKKHNHTKKGLQALALGACLAGSLLMSAPASALTVEVLPAVSSVALGGTVQVDVHVSDLTNLAAPSLGAYDLSVLFDAAALQYSHVTWGNQLDLSGLGSMTLPNESSAATGLLNFAEISYDSIAQLNDEQLGSFTLFSLFFTAAALGNTQVDLDVLALSDAEGFNLTADAVNSGDITVVPVPAALPLLASGLLLLMGRLRRRA